jgi:membrane peptidoglycan carboxypeptidase
MNTSLARRQRHRRNGYARRGGGGGPARTVAIAFPLFLFSTFLLLGVVGFVAAVGAYGYYSQGLTDPKTAFSELTFDEQTVVYDRTGKVELARFGQTQRQVIDTYDELAPVLVDATTSIEDKTFWDNAGFDPLGIIAAAVDTARGRDRGASTITQQLVRARLLPQSAFDGSVYERKIKEIIQSIRLTQEYPGTDGKKEIMVAYLNQNYYGDQSYGVAAAAKDYFGVTDLHKLTIAQAAILAAIPQSPTTYDLRKNAEEKDSADGKTTELVVPSDSEIVARRNRVLDAMILNRVLTRPGTPDAITDDQIQAAKAEPVVIKPDASSDWRAPHFVWQVRHQLGSILCGAENADNCQLVDTGGFQVTTTLDWPMQKIAEKWAKGAAIAPNAKDPAKYLKDNKIPFQGWIRNLVGRGVYNSALAALDYRTGQVYAYVGSASYYEKPRGRRFQPQFDVLSDGFRQAGSAFKPINYITGLDDKTTTAATMYMDVTTNIAGGYTPTDADLSERGPIRMRQALQLSLNIPAVKNVAMLGAQRVYDEAKKFGITFAPGTQPVVSEGIGTLDLHYADLLSAYGAIADSGKLMPRTYIQVVRDSNGKQIWPEKGAKAPAGKQIVSPQAAYIMTDILASNTDPSQNAFWGRRAIYDGSRRRPATLKTGTSNDQIDLAAFGYLAPPKDPKAPALVVGAWMGNSDNSIPPNGTVALESAATLWQAFLTQASKGMPIADFKQPPGIVHAKVDAFSGMKPGPFSRRTVTENFIEGTQPKDVDNTKKAMAIDEATGKLWQDGCVGPKVTKGFFDVSQIDSAFPQWQKYDRGWAARAAKGVGVRGGPKGTRTAYFGFGNLPFGASWGAPFPPKEKCPIGPPPSPSPSCDPFFGCPSPSGFPSPSPTPTPKPRVASYWTPGDRRRRLATTRRVARAARSPGSHRTP